MSEQPAWRETFPVEWPQQQFAARRDFTKFLMLTSLPFALGQLWIALQNGWRRYRDRPPVRAVARLDDVPVGGAVPFHYPGKDDPCLLVRPDAGTLLAYSQKCTHLGCAVVPEVEQKCFYCPCHLGYFDLTSGRPTSGPPRRPLPRVTLETRGGVVYATGMEVSAS